jgi:hypothetical protein
MPEAIDHARAQRRRFRDLLARPTISIMPGGFSPLYARMAWRVMNDLHDRGPQAIYDYADEMRASKWGSADQRMLTNLEHVREIEEQFLPARAQRDYDNTWGHVSVLAPGAEEK